MRRGRKQAKPTTAVVEESATVASEAKFVEQIESTSRRKPPPLNVQWSDEDKSKESYLRPDKTRQTSFLDLFLSLLAQHGDDFKRIAASMPNKVNFRLASIEIYSSLYD